MSQTVSGSAPLIGKRIERVDGRLKVTGGAHYAAEFKVPNLTYGALVMSTIASGKIKTINSKEAEAAPGVIAVISHFNAERLPFPEKRLESDPVYGRTLRVLQEDTIYFNAQPVAVVIAETLEQAEYAATLVKVAYDQQKHVTSLEAELSRAFRPQEGVGENVPLGRFADVVRGDPDALNKAEVTIDETY